MVTTNGFVFEISFSKFYYLLQTISIIIMKGEKFFFFSNNFYGVKNEATIQNNPPQRLRF
ncbi:hypothetical protein E4N77_09350 [Treponema denticola]|nr:hypothetical protein E4N77_09350 [Treponema denticola]